MNWAACWEWGCQLGGNGLWGGVEPVHWDVCWGASWVGIMDCGVEWNRGIWAGSWGGMATEKWTY